VGTRVEPASGAGLRLLLDNIERALIIVALEAARGEQRRAASVLGVLPTTLQAKMKRLRIAVVYHGSESGGGVVLSPPQPSHPELALVRVEKAPRRGTCPGLLRLLGARRAEARMEAPPPLRGNGHG
jgi:hypothetical protein